MLEHCVCHVISCIVCHFIALCMLGCILVAFHACHAYRIVFGIGVSPSTGDEVRFILRVTECVSIPSHRHSGLSMMELGFSCVFMCIHPILNCAIRLLGHHASVYVIGGTRIEACIYLWYTLLCPYPALCCSNPRINKLPEFGALSKKNHKTEANRGIPVDFRAKQPKHTAFIRSKAVPGLHASFTAFLVKLIN